MTSRSIRPPRASSRHALSCLLGLSGVAFGAGGCASQSAPAPAHAAAAPPAAAPIVIPESVPLALAERHVVATGLRNPRGMQPLASGALLVAEAGTGVPGDELSGRLSRFEDRNGDGDYSDEGEQRPLLERQLSKNIMNIVRRDEVFGMAGMAEGGDTTLVGMAFFGGPSTVYRIDGDAVTTWTTTHGNVNDLTFDPVRKQWFAVSSTSDEIVRIAPGVGAQRVLKIPPLASGQDAVPGYLRHDPVTGKLFVALFTGSPEGEEGGLGVELQPRAGGIIAVDPDSGQFEWVVTGLTVPTDLDIAPDGTIYVLEFCDAFLDPAASHEELMAKGPNHGGFRHFSGRLLRIDRRTRAVSELARGLDTPTNLVLSGPSLLVAQGMGTPGRPIPGPDGVRPLTGFIERVAIGP